MRILQLYAEFSYSLCTESYFMNRVGKNHDFFEKKIKQVGFFWFKSFFFFEQNKLSIMSTDGGKGMLTFHALFTEMITSAVVLKFLSVLYISG